MGDKNTPEEIILARADALIKEITADYEQKIEEAFKLGAELGAQKGAEAAIEAAEKERRKARDERYNWQFRNTKLLLQHYRQLNAHCSNAVWEDDEADKEEYSTEVFLDLMRGRDYSETVFVDSIKASAEKTRIIMKHVNKMLLVYEDYCQKSKYPEDKRHWRVIKALYLNEDKSTAKEIADREHIFKRTVYKDVDAAVDDLTMLLFGIDGIENL